MQTGTGPMDSSSLKVRRTVRPGASGVRRPGMLIGLLWMCGVAGWAGDAAFGQGCGLLTPDLNEDGVVDGADLGLFQLYTPDFNGDGVSDAADLGILFLTWGPYEPDHSICLVLSHWGPSAFWSEAPPLERAFMAHGQVGAWPRLRQGEDGLEFEHDGMVHWASFPTIEQHIAGVRAWAERLPDDEIWAAFDYEWDYLPWERLHDFRREATQGQAEAYEAAWASWFRGTVAVLGDARPRAKRAWFVTKRWHTSEAVAACAPFYAEIEGVIVSIYSLAEIVSEEERDPPYKLTYEEVVEGFEWRLRSFVDALEGQDTEVIAGLNFRIHTANPNVGRAEPITEMQARASLEAMERAGVRLGWLWSAGGSPETFATSLKTAHLYHRLLMEKHGLPVDAP